MQAAVGAWERGEKRLAEEQLSNALELAKELRSRDKTADVTERLGTKAFVGVGEKSSPTIRLKRLLATRPVLSFRPRCVSRRSTACIPSRGKVLPNRHCRPCA